MMKKKFLYCFFLCFTSMKANTWNPNLSFFHTVVVKSPVQLIIDYQLPEGRVLVQDTHDNISNIRLKNKDGVFSIEGNLKKTQQPVISLSGKNIHMIRFYSSAQMSCQYMQHEDLSIQAGKNSIVKIQSMNARNLSIFTVDKTNLEIQGLAEKVEAHAAQNSLLDISRLYMNYSYLKATNKSCIKAGYANQSSALMSQNEASIIYYDDMSIMSVQLKDKGSVSRETYRLAANVAQR